MKYTDPTGRCNVSPVEGSLVGCVWDAVTGKVSEGANEVVDYSIQKTQEQGDMVDTGGPTPTLNPWHAVGLSAQIVEGNPEIVLGLPLLAKPLFRANKAGKASNSEATGRIVENKATIKQEVVSDFSVVEKRVKPDFYVTEDGIILPSTFYRYGNSKYAPISEAKSGVLPAKRGGMYVSFDKMDDAVVASDKLQIPYRPDYRVSGDTLDVIENIKVPKGDWGRADYLEPVTKDFKKFGPGDVTQATIAGKVPVDPTTIEKLQ
jgi:hypothetical protein